jgi:membrane fusion protein (multidrug efflux system)
MFRERRKIAEEAEPLADLAEGEPALAHGAEADVADTSSKRSRRPSLRTVKDEARTPTLPHPVEEPSPAPPDKISPEPPAPGQRPDAEFTPKPKRRLRKMLLTIGLLAALAGAGWYGHYWWAVGRFIVSTDDAYVGAKSATIAAKVSGYVTAVAVDDNQHVKTGEVIARIDDGDYALAVQTAKDKIASQQATIERIEKQILAQGASVDQAEANLASAKAGLTRAELELKRQQALAAKDFASHQALEQAQANRDQAAAAVQGGDAAVEAAKTNIDVLKAQKEEAVQVLNQLKTELAKAERDLSFTAIRAPYDGVVGNRAVEVGDYVEPGQRLATLVPLGAVYIDANFKETQLSGLKPGQVAEITVDALPGKTIKGKVVSVAPASGSVFSLLPPDNATGNFTKIVQRLPVRIAVPADLAAQEVLRPGMSVVVSVNSKQTAVAPSTPAGAPSPAVATVKDATAPAPRL